MRPLLILLIATLIPAAVGFYVYETMSTGVKLNITLTAFNPDFIVLTIENIGSSRVCIQGLQGNMYVDNVWLGFIDWSPEGRACIEPGETISIPLDAYLRQPNDPAWRLTTYSRILRNYLDDLRLEVLFKGFILVRPDTLLSQTEKISFSISGYLDVREWIEKRVKPALEDLAKRLEQLRKGSKEAEKLVEEFSRRASKALEETSKKLREAVSRVSEVVEEAKVRAYRASEQMKREVIETAEKASKRVEKVETRYKHAAQVVQEEVNRAEEKLREELINALRELNETLQKLVEKTRVNVERPVNTTIGKVVESIEESVEEVRESISKLLEELQTKLNSTQG